MDISDTGEVSRSRPFSSEARRQRVRQPKLKAGPTDLVLAKESVNRAQDPKSTYTVTTLQPTKKGEKRKRRNLAWDWTFAFCWTYTVDRMNKIVTNTKIWQEGLLDKGTGGNEGKGKDARHVLRTAVSSLWSMRRHSSRCGRRAEDTKYAHSNNIPLHNHLGWKTWWCR